MKTKNIGFPSNTSDYITFAFIVVFFIIKGRTAIGYVTSNKGKNRPHNNLVPGSVHNPCTQIFLISVIMVVPRVDQMTVLTVALMVVTTTKESRKQVGGEVTEKSPCRATMLSSRKCQ